MPFKKKETTAAPETSNEPTWSDEKEQKGADVIYVRARRVGFYENVRYYPQGHEHPRAGEIFALRPRTGGRKTKEGKVVPVEISAESQFSKEWMERVDEEEARKDASLRSRMPRSPAIIRKTAADRAVI